MPAEFPEIRYRSPINLLGAASDLRPNIEMQWSVDIDTAQFSDPSSLANIVRVINETTSEIVPLEYDSYSTRTKILKLAPTTDLDRGTLYSVYVDKEVLATTGRKSKQIFYWQFSTAEGALGSLSLLDPADSSVQITFPELIWMPASGSVSYIVQVDDRWDFGSPVYQATTSATSLIPIGAFTDETTYYWRVRAYTDIASGAWSDTRQFYYGTPRNALAGTKQNWYGSDSFGLESTGWVNGLSNQSAFPTIRISFTSNPETNYEQFISVWKRQQIPRNDSLTTFQESIVAGSWTQSGSSITFTPSETIQSNTRYEIRILSDLINTEGTKLGIDYSLYFTSSYSPMYADVMAIRSRFLGAEQHIPDDLINYWIYKRSLEAQAKYYMYLQGQPVTLGNQPPESLVRDSPRLTSYGVGKWVESAAVLSVLQAILNENLRLVDSERKLGDYTSRLGPGFLKAIEMAIKSAQEELDYWEDFLTVEGQGRVAVRSSLWSPQSRSYDLSIWDLEARRDNRFYD